MPVALAQRATPTNRVHFDDIPLRGITEVPSPSAPIDTPSKTWGTVATILKQIISVIIELY